MRALRISLIRMSDLREERILKIHDINKPMQFLPLNGAGHLDKQNTQWSISNFEIVSVV